LQAFTEMLRESEDAQLESNGQYEEALVKQSIVHARQDIALLCFEMREHSRALVRLKWILVLIACLLGYLAWVIS
jgi:hypothetical protein